MIKAGQKWKFVWQQAGNNGDGIVGTDDGALLLRPERQQRDPEARQGRQAVGRVSGHAHRRIGDDQSKRRRMFVVERGLHQRIEQILPQRKVFADTYNGEPLDCLGGVINDNVSDSKGGVYPHDGPAVLREPAEVSSRSTATT